MSYVFTGNCPNCGAPIFVSKGRYKGVNPNDPEEYPEIEYNCNCYKEERKRVEAKSGGNCHTQINPSIHTG